MSRCGIVSPLFVIEEETKIKLDIRILINLYLSKRMYPNVAFFKDKDIISNDEQCQDLFQKSDIIIVSGLIENYKEDAEVLFDSTERKYIVYDYLGQFKNHYNIVSEYSKIDIELLKGSNSEVSDKIKSLMNEQIEKID